MLSLLLADEFIIYVATRECHWNFTGLGFDSPPELFEEQYQQLADWTELLSEHTRKINARTAGSWTELIKAARLTTKSGAGLSPGQMIKGLIDLHEAMIGQLQRDKDACRQVWHDAVSANFLTVLLLKHAKAARQLQAVLANQPGGSPA